MIPTTSSQSEPPTENAEPDRPQTDKPDGDMSMPNPSQFLITSSSIGGQFSFLSSVTATATVANTQSATSNSVETSFRSQIPIITPHPMSTSGTMLSTTDTIVSTTTETQSVATVQMSVVFSTGKPDVLTNLSLLPTSTTTNTFSVDRPPPDQSETGGTVYR